MKSNPSEKSVGLSPSELASIAGLIWKSGDMELRDAAVAAVGLWLECNRLVSKIQSECLHSFGDGAHLDCTTSGFRLGGPADSEALDWVRIHATAKKDRDLAWDGLVSALIDFQYDLIGIFPPDSARCEPRVSTRCESVLARACILSPKEKLQLCLKEAPELVFETIIPGRELRKFLRHRTVQRAEARRKLRCQK